MGEERGPLSWHDLARSFDEHRKEDRDNFDGMKRSFESSEAAQTSIARKQDALDSKQDEQIDVLNKLLDQANAAAEERGRRVQRESDEAKAKKRRDEIYKWLRWVLIPLAVVVYHFLTKAVNTH